jgi:hypothetical protein
MSWRELNMQVRSSSRTLDRKDSETKSRSRLLISNRVGAILSTIWRDRFSMKPSENDHLNSACNSWSDDSEQVWFRSSKDLCRVFGRPFLRLMDMFSHYAEHGIEASWIVYCCLFKDDGLLRSYSSICPVTVWPDWYEYDGPLCCASNIHSILYLS